MGLVQYNSIVFILHGLYHTEATDNSGNRAAVRNHGDTKSHSGEVILHKLSI